MKYEKIFLPKINPFRLYIYSLKENLISLKTFSKEKIISTKLSKLNSQFSYCNSFNNLFISEGNDFWIINHSSFQIKYKKMPIQKSGHSLLFIPNEEGKIFIVGGKDKKSFYYDLKKNYFLNWAETNFIHINPALINLGDYLYIIDTNKNNDNKIIFERTKLTDKKKYWEIIEPKYEENIINNLPNEFFGVSLDSKGNFIFIGGNNINMENNTTYVYNINENNIYLSNQGTNDNMIFKDRSFYFYDNGYNVALPENLDEIKEIAFVDKIEQSLIKTNIDVAERKIKYDYNYNNINIKNEQIQQKNRIIKNENTPKEYGYFMSSYSSTQAKINAKKNKIDVIEANKINVNIPIINKQRIDNENEIKIEKIKNEEIKIEENYVEQKIEEQNQNNIIDNNKEEIYEEHIQNQEKDNIEENNLETNQEKEIIQDNNIKEQDENININDNIQYEEINTDIKPNEENINQKYEKEIINNINNEKNIEQEEINDNNNIEVEKNIEHEEENYEQQQNIENNEQQENKIEGEEKHEELEEHFEQEEKEHEQENEQENMNDQNENEHYEEEQQIINEQEHEHEQEQENEQIKIEERNYNEQEHEQEQEKNYEKQHEIEQEQEQEIKPIENTEERNQEQEQYYEEHQEINEQEQKNIEENNEENKDINIQEQEEYNQEKENKLENELNDLNQKENKKTIENHNEIENQQPSEEKPREEKNEIEQEKAEINAEQNQQSQEKNIDNNEELETPEEIDIEKLEKRLDNIMNKKLEEGNIKFNEVITQETIKDSNNEISIQKNTDINIVEGDEKVHIQIKEQTTPLQNSTEQKNEVLSSQEKSPNVFISGEENVEEEHFEEQEENGEIKDEGENVEEEENGEYEEQERDTLLKTITENIGEDVMQIPDYLIAYYNEENFCDYEP